jgi:hypothetical protein
MWCTAGGMGLELSVPAAIIVIEHIKRMSITIDKA